MSLHLPVETKVFTNDELLLPFKDFMEIAWIKVAKEGAEVFKHQDTDTFKQEAFKVWLGANALASVRQGATTNTIDSATIKAYSGHADFGTKWRRSMIREGSNAMSGAPLKVLPPSVFDSLVYTSYLAVEGDSLAVEGDSLVASGVSSGGEFVNGKYASFHYLDVTSKESRWSNDRTWVWVMLGVLRRPEIFRAEINMDRSDRPINLVVKDPQALMGIFEEYCKKTKTVADVKLEASKGMIKSLIKSYLKTLSDYIVASDRAWDAGDLFWLPEPVANFLKAERSVRDILVRKAFCGPWGCGMTGMNWSIATPDLAPMAELQGQMGYLEEAYIGLHAAQKELLEYMPSLQNPSTYGSYRSEYWNCFGLEQELYRQMEDAEERMGFMGVKDKTLVRIFDLSMETFA